MKEQSSVCSQLGEKDKHNEISITSGFSAPEIVHLIIYSFMLLLYYFKS